MQDDAKIYEGPISITPRGIGFLTIGTDQNGKPLEDLLIPREWIDSAFSGDIVKVQAAGYIEDQRSRSRRAAGKVIEIVSRSRETFVGKLVEDQTPGAPHGQVIMIPDWKKMYTPFVVKGDNLPIGQKIVLRFRAWPKDAPLPWGVVEEIIGPAGEHETEMRALALGQGFHSDFPPAVIAEAKKLEEDGKRQLDEEAAASVASGRRKDFRKTPTFTIDPYDAKDFDDAISVKFLDNGNTEVGVHIADVSFFVRPGTAIDDEARNRATSVYLVDRTIPMLPHVLSTNLASLNPHEDRLAVSAVFELDSEANIVSKWFGETAIYSDHRFTYEDAQDVLESGNGPLHAELAAIRDLSKKIRKRRVAKGAIEFDTPEVKVKLDDTGKPIDIILKERKDTNLLIEDLMLLANENVAEMLSEEARKANINPGSIYRVHDLPNPDRIEDLAQFLRVMGYELPTHAGHVKGTDINALMKKVEGTPEEYLIKTAALRSMAKATYTTKNIGHFGLAFEHYTHFTSPIRRYPDLLVHRMLKHFKSGEPFTQAQFLELDPLAIHSSEREVAAAQAERDSVKMKQVEYMVDKIGQEFEGVISGVSDRGVFVELKTTHAEGMIRIRDLGNDYFIYDEKRYRIVGERTKVQYALGDPIRVKLIATRVLEREMDFALADSPTTN